LTAVEEQSPYRAATILLLFALGGTRVADDAHNVSARASVTRSANGAATESQGS